jgi:hypothetical protein
MLNSGEIEAYAANRERLAGMSVRFPGLRQLPDNFFGVEQAMIVSKGNATALEYLNQFIESARNSGFIKSVLERAKLSGVEVAPSKSR